MDADHTVASRVGHTFGPYQIRSLIGRGGMGEVYEAFDSRRNRVVALKLLPKHASDDESYRARFRRESQLAARLQEPHVVPIHDFGEIDGILFIDMRLVRGRDLRSLINESGFLPPQRAVAIIEQVAAALDAAHRDGLVHRDVKPENILVDSNDFAYLADFGIAASEAETKLTATGMAVGSYAYMAPERFTDAAPTPAVDIYSLACVLFECLTGQKPFPRATVSALISAHLHEPPPRPSLTGNHVATAFDGVVGRGMAKRPEQRFPTTRELSAAARDAFSGVMESHRSDAPTMARIPPTTVEPNNWAPRNRTERQPVIGGAIPGMGGGPGSSTGGRRGSLMLVAVSVVALAAIGFAAFTLMRPSQNDAAPSGLASSLPGTTIDTPTTTGTSTADRTVTVQAPPETVTVPQTIGQLPQPQQAEQGMDLGVSVPMSYPACDGMGIVVLYSAITPGAYSNEIQAALNRFPGSKYLRTDGACPSLRQSLNGNPIYAVYRDGGYSKDALCSAVWAAGGDAYGKWLDMTSDPTLVVSC